MLDRLDHVASLPACTSQKGAGLWLSCSELDHVSGSITLLPQERCSPGTCVHSKCRTPLHRIPGECHHHPRTAQCRNWAQAGEASGSEGHCWQVTGLRVSPECVSSQSVTSCCLPHPALTLTAPGQEALSERMSERMSE